MEKEYIVKKEDLKHEFNAISVIFNNDDYIEIYVDVNHPSKFIEKNFNFYDNLIFENNAICPVLESGYIKIDTQRNSKCSFLANVFDQQDFEKNKREYVQNRLNNDQIKCICFGYCYSGAKFFAYGNILAKADNNSITLEFLPSKKDMASNGENCKISLKDITPHNVKNIFLEFELEETFQVFQSEIIDITLNFNKNLSLTKYNLCREIKSGHILIDINKNARRKRITELNNKTSKINNIIDNLFGKERQNINNILKIYAEFKSPHEEVKILELLKTQDTQHFSLDDMPIVTYYRGVISNVGTIERLEDGKILITFKE